MSRRLAFVLLAACTPTTFAFSPMVNGVASKPDGCPMEVVASPPARDYREIGTLDYYNGPEPKTLDAFKAAIANRACNVGADAVIAIADAKGQFTKGSVIVYTSQSATPTPPARPGSPPEQKHRPASPPEQKHDSEIPK